MVAVVVDTYVEKPARALRERERERDREREIVASRHPCLRSKLNTVKGFTENKFH